MDDFSDFSLIKKEPDDNSVSSFLTSLCIDHDPSNNPEITNFYFESDYLPLKGNTDYLKLMRTLSILEIQRIKVLQDIERLENMVIRTKDDPITVFQEIITKKSLYNGRCEIEKVPEIDWSKYRDVCSEPHSSTLTTRRKAKVENRNPYADVVESSSVETKEGKIKVRGRVFDENKPETFNQLWTVEEQLRLEELLVEYPAEAVEHRRWKKIANALGNRTASQVCSRVQKYFRKLKKAGIAVPGKIPRRDNSKPRLVHRRNKHLLYRPTTFFPGVSMKEIDDDQEEGCSQSVDLSHWVDILAQVKEEKMRENSESVLHHGYSCHICNETPIKGLRWECKVCPAVSVCCDCVAGILDSKEPVHPPSHVFSARRLYTNPNYNAQSAFSSSSYMDPNFIP